MSAKVQDWVKEIQQLAKAAVSQPHAAHAAFTHGLSSRWSCLLRTIPDIQDLLLPLENAIHHHFIPALTGRPPCSSLERDLLSLPVRLGGLGLRNPAVESPSTFQASQRLTAPLVALIVAQESKQIVDLDSISNIKRSIKTSNRLRQIQLARNVHDHNSLHSSSDVSILHRKRARHHGSQFSHLRNMDSIYTKENSGMHYA